LVEGGRHVANSVSKNKGITYLNLSDNQLGPKAGMAFARSLKDNHVLAHLDLKTNKLGYKAGQAFAIAMMHNTSLISINLENNDFGPNVGKKWATAIQRNVGLTDIDFSNNDLGKHSHLGGEPDELGVMLKRALEANCQLTSLNFSGCHFDSKTFIAVCGAFMRMEALRVLKLDDLILDEPSTLQLCNALENFPVKILSLARCNIGDSAKAANLLANCLRSLQTLVSLDLSGNILGSRRDMNEALSEALQADGMHIRELNLRGNRLGPEGGALVAAGLGHLHTLEWLDVSDNDLDADVCRELAESLREVISFGIVKKECTIRHFEGSNNDFGDEAASELIMAFYNEVTHFIGLQNCNLGPLTGDSLGKGLSRPTISWEELNISDNLLGKEGANSVWWSMRLNHSLLSLNMENNKIGPEFGTEEDEFGLHGISIDTALERNFTLRNLIMDNNGISAKAGVMFAGSLSTNMGLQNIRFQDNNLDHVVGEYIGERLEIDNQIVSLNFNGNNLGWEGGKAIANALFTNRFLVSLDLGNNKIGENGPRVGLMFAKALYQNNVLKSLKLEGNR
jgi:Ran GTPase-activating protein (RanGAP) involved in mRNA processing and transport